MYILNTHPKIVEQRAFFNKLKTDFDNYFTLTKVIALFIPVCVSNATMTPIFTAAALFAWYLYSRGETKQLTTSHTNLVYTRWTDPTSEDYLGEFMANEIATECETRQTLHTPPAEIEWRFVIPVIGASMLNMTGILLTASMIFLWMCGAYIRSIYRDFRSFIKNGCHSSTAAHVFSLRTLLSNATVRLPYFTWVSASYVEWIGGSYRVLIIGIILYCFCVCMLYLAYYGPQFISSYGFFSSYKEETNIVKIMDDKIEDTLHVAYTDITAPADYENDPYKKYARSTLFDWKHSDAPMQEPTHIVWKNSNMDAADRMMVTTMLGASIPNNSAPFTVIKSNIPSNGAGLGIPSPTPNDASNSMVRTANTTPDASDLEESSDADFRELSEGCVTNSMDFEESSSQECQFDVLDESKFLKYEQIDDSRATTTYLPITKK